jgi:hypothetical protein
VFHLSILSPWGDFKFPARRAFGASETGHLFSEQRAHVLFWRIFSRKSQVADGGDVGEFSSHSPGVDVVRFIGPGAAGWVGTQASAVHIVLVNAHAP